MTIVCIPNCAFLSETSRQIAIYKALTASDMHAVLATHGGPYDFLFEREGVPCTRLDPPMTNAEAARYLAAIFNPMLRFYRPAVLREHVANEIAFFRKCGARAVVSGFTLSTALSARAAGVPLIVTHAGSFVPIVIERGLFRWSDAFDNLLLDIVPHGWFDRLIGWMHGPPLPRLRALNIVARQLGIAPVLGVADVLLGDLTLVTDAPEILGISEADMEAWRPPTRHIRPTARMRYAGPIYAELFGEVPEDVRAFLAATEKPRVYVALASTDPSRIARVCSTLASMDVRAVVVTTIHEGRFTASSNILLKPFLPSHKVMPLCDLVIIHGGQGSVQSAIAAGVPLIGIPLQPEQFFNVKQVERHGAGRCLSLRDFKKGKLRAAIQDVLEDPSCRTAMGKLQRFQAARNGPCEVARAIRQLVTILPAKPIPAKMEE